MKKGIVIDLNELSRQQEALMNSNIDEDSKEGLLNLTSAILDLAKDNSKKEKIGMVLAEE